MAESNTGRQDKTSIWQHLRAHQRQIAGVHMRDLFRADPQRARTLSCRIDDLLIDYSRHRINDETLALLFSLADACAIADKITALFAGKNINSSENRPALHGLLRAPAAYSLQLDGTDIVPLIHTQLARMRNFVRRLHHGDIRGATGKAIEKIINIGIGGSDLGPRLATEALHAFKSGGIDVEFVSNLDPRELADALAGARAETTLFIVVSKSFTTLETRTNAAAAKQWLETNGCLDHEQHIVAVTSKYTAAKDFGVKDDYIFYFWDWVGGRYSLWSSVGLSIAIAIGMDNFQDMLAGGHCVDTHFQTAPVNQNIPVILGLLGVWYNNFFGADSHAVIPYDQSLRLLPEYLAQLVMESNGKSVTRDGHARVERTSPIVWGAIGTNAQHAFFQMLHQGTHLVPIDFLLPLQSSCDQAQHKKLVSNCLAQGEALMRGQADDSDPNKQFVGNKPSTTITYSSLTPRVLGMLIAIYEHKTFVEAMLWDINPFDQWGVELGKKLARQILQDLSPAGMETAEHDASTQLLMQEYLHRNK